MTPLYVVFNYQLFLSCTRTLGKVGRLIGCEIGWQGLVAKDRFYVTYHGEVLSPSMEEVLVAFWFAHSLKLDPKLKIP